MTKDKEKKDSISSYDFRDTKVSISEALLKYKLEALEFRTRVLEEKKKLSEKREKSLM